MTRPSFSTLTKYAAAVATAPLLLFAGCAVEGTASAAPAASASASSVPISPPSPTPTLSASETPSEDPEDITEARIIVCNALDGDTTSDEWSHYECDKVADQLDATDSEPEVVEPEVVAFEPKAKDFKVTIKVREKECFGSAGCNVTYRIKPEYVGEQSLPDTGEIEVFYKVKGAEDPIENYFTVDSDGTAHFDSEENASTSSANAKLTVKVTDVSYSE